MTDYQLGMVESKFADIIWKNEPIKSSELVNKCEDELKWKKSTTYTVLRRLCEKGIFVNEDGIVSSLISCDEFYSRGSRKYVDDNFKGSLPAFIAAFTSEKKLSSDEIEDLQRLIDSLKED